MSDQQEREAVIDQMVGQLRTLATLLVSGGHHATARELIARIRIACDEATTAIDSTRNFDTWGHK